ncbi:MAG TPA: ATP-binding protein [Labilithrix sp.]|nr:ATP-binding protein [Labilithrix sp.]
MDDESTLKARIAALEQENARLRAGIFEPSSPQVVEVPAAVQPLFADAANAIRQVFQQIDIDPARAMIGIGEERYLLVRASAFAIDFLDTLVELYADRGEREALAIARGFLFDIAHTIGLHDARAIHDRLGSQDPLERLSGGPVHFAYTGWSLVTILEASRPVPNDDFCLVYEHRYSFEAASFLRAGRGTEGPVCIMSAGYSSGWCEASFGLPLTAVEVRCKARGDDACLFVMAPPDKIAGRIAEHFGTSERDVTEGGFDIPTYFERKRAEEELRHSLMRLKEAQEELVRKERLATVGLLVSGVAHEVNTPLGVAVTATGIVSEEMTALRDKLDRGVLTKGDLRQFFERAGQAEEMVRTNLERAAAEIMKFKRVSVDHTTEERRRIDVGVYVRETLDSLRPLARRASLEITLTADGDLEVVTYPGAIAQILTNFVTNSVMHGSHGDGTPLRIEVHVARLEDGSVTIAYRDYGRGMPDHVREKAFQPFFTTQRGAGGSGLGLHIVQSIVADVLRGRIFLDSTLGEGTRFVVNFPVATSLT